MLLVRNRRLLEVMGVLDDMCVLRLAWLLAAVQSSHTMPLTSLVPRREGFEKRKRGCNSDIRACLISQYCKKGLLLDAFLVEKRCAVSAGSTALIRVLLDDHILTRGLRLELIF